MNTLEQKQQELAELRAWAKELDDAVVNLQWHYSFAYQQLAFCAELVPEYTGKGEWARDDVEDCIATLKEVEERYAPLVGKIKGRNEKQEVKE